MLIEQLKFNFYVSRTDTLSEVLEPHKNVFHKKLGIIERFKTDIKLQDVAKPVFCKARPVLYAWCIPMWKKMDLLESPEVVRWNGVTGRLPLSVCQRVIEAYASVVASRGLLIRYFLTTPTLRIYS